jgi:hypothetical protein
MTAEELQQYRDQLLRDQALSPLYVPRRFTALPESGNLSSDLEFRTYGMLRDREPTLEEVLTHPSIAIVADPGAGKSVVGRAAVEHLLTHSDRLPVFAEVKQYRVDLPTLFRITTPAALLEPRATINGVALKRTYVLDGIDEIPKELLQRLGAELRDFMENEPGAHFVVTARQAFYVANRNLLPPIPAVFHILPFATEDIEQYCANADVDSDRFMKAIHAVSAAEEVRNPFILSVMVQRFRDLGSLSELRSENLSYMIDRLIQSRPQVNAHRQRRALRMLGVAMETYSRNELTEEEALRVIREAVRLTEQQARELLDELYASILKRTGNGLSFLLASYGEYLAAEALEDAPLSRLKELAFLDFSTPNDSWENAVSYLLELNSSVRRAFVRQYPIWTLTASTMAFSEHEKDVIVNQILKELTANNQLVSDHPRINVRRLTTFITTLTESVLEKDLASRNDVITGNALILLGVRGNPGIVSLAMDILSDRQKNPGSRMAAVMALVNSGSSALVPRLLEIAHADDPLNINIVDLIGGLTDETQLMLTLPVIIRTNAGLSAAYYHFRELKSRSAVIAVLRFFLEHPNDLNSIRTEGYVEPILKLIPRYWDDEIPGLLVDLIDFIETNHFYPDHNGPFRKLFAIVGTADAEGTVPRIYFERLAARREADRRRMYYVDQTLAGLMRPPTARWLIEHEAFTMIENLAPYLHGEVRELLRPHSNGVIDAQDAAAQRYREEQFESELARKTSIVLVQERLLTRRTLTEALVDFVELQQEHWPELPGAFRTWLAEEISRQLGRLDLEHTVEWRDNSLWQPQVLPLLLEIVERYELHIDPDEPLVFAAMSMDRNIAANHYRRFGFTDHAKQTLERLLGRAPSNQALNELIRFVENAGIWSDGIAEAMRAVVRDPANKDKEYVQVTALNLLMQHSVDDDFVSQVYRDGTSTSLRSAAFEGLISRQHRPTIERSLGRLLNDELELRRGEVPMPNQTPLDWIAKIRADFALPKLIELRAQALRLQLATVTQLLSNTIGAINRRELVRVIRQQLDVTPPNWHRWQMSQAIEQERTATIEEAQRTPFDSVIKKLKGATSLNRLKVFCEGANDIPVFDELVAQAGEAPEIIFGDVGGWPGLRNKDPEFLLLGSRAVIVIMDGDQGRELSKQDRPLTDVAQEQENRLARHGIDLYILRRYGIENYLPRQAVERVLGVDLSAYFPVPDHVPFTEQLSEDNKGLRYRLRRWMALKLDLKMPQPRRPLYSKAQNRDVAKLINLEADLAGTDLFQIVQSIVQRARELQED